MFDMFLHRFDTKSPFKTQLQTLGNRFPHRFPLLLPQEEKDVASCFEWAFCEGSDQKHAIQPLWQSLGIYIPSERVIGDTYTYIYIYIYRLGGSKYLVGGMWTPRE